MGYQTPFTHSPTSLATPCKSTFGNGSRRRTGTLVFAFLLLLACRALGQTHTPEVNGVFPKEFEDILKGLPRLSPLRNLLLERGPELGGTHQPYMDLMRTTGVKRVLLEVDTVWKSGEPSSLKIAWRLFYTNYDGPNSRVADVKRLTQFRDSGLEASLDRLAIDRVSRAQMWCVDCKDHLRKGDAVYAYVEFFDTPLLQETRTTLQLEAKRKPLYQAVAIGNPVLVADLMESHHFSQEELTRALFLAADNPLNDTTDVIEILLRTGADINGRGAAGTTVLMVAVRNPAHLEYLIKKGANLNAQDDSGKTALDYASDHGEAEHLLKRAGAISGVQLNRRRMQ